MSDNINYLWSGESAWCICGHHVECHRTGIVHVAWNTFHGFCGFKDKKPPEIVCNCHEFIPYRIKEK